jgi:hypothetical protein
MPRLKWNRELVEAEARKYSTYTEFKNGNRGAFKWAARNGVINEVTAFMYEVTDPDELMQRIKGELGSAARDAKVARDMWESDPSPFYEPSDDPEQITEGTYMDFEAQMYDQASFERSDRALDHIEALQEHGTPEQVKEAWDMYLAYQTGDWEVEGAFAGIYMQGGEQGGSCE